MEFAAINSPAAAFVAGLVTSLHCAGMCGPLACMILPTKGDRGDAQTVATVYQLSRVAGYTLLGAAAGGLGRAPLQLLSSSALKWLPWVLVIFLVSLALRLDRLIPKPTWLAKFTFRLQGAMRRRSRVEAAAVMGAMTPLLPCGPLYFILAMALVTGSALRGAEFMLAFGFGTMPLLWLAQSQFHWVRQRMSLLWMSRMRIVFGLTTALLIGWRLRGTLGFAGPDPSTFICF